MRLEDIYIENVFIGGGPKPVGFNWVRSLQARGIKMVSNDTVNLVRRDVNKTKPFQIKHGIEDLDQNNRHIKISLTLVQKHNQTLRFELEQEEAKLEYLKSVIQNSRPMSMERSRVDPGNVEIVEQNLSKNELGFGHLNKNLQLQIHLTNNEIKKLETQLEKLKATEDFYNLIELIAVNKVYSDEFERLSSIKNKLENAQQVVADQKKQVKLVKTKKNKMKVKRLESKISQIENDIGKSEKFIAEFKSKTSELIKHDESLSLEKNQLQRELDQMNARIEHYTSRIKGLTNKCN
jgi:hypothetical protein